MNVRRGDLVTIAVSGDYGKPRPALVIQADAFDSIPSVTGSVSSFEKQPEAFNQTLNKIHHLMERWEQRITLRNLRLSDRFLKLELHILLDFIVKDTGERWIACLEKIPEGREPIVQHDAIAVNRKQSTMLIDVVKLVDSPEQIVPILVWLECIDSFYGFGAHTLYFSSLLPFVSNGILSNREFDEPRRRKAGTYPNQLICQVIEGATEVLDDITGGTNSREAQGSKRPKSEDRGDELSRREITCLYAKDSWIILSEQLSRCQIRIGGDSVNLLVPKSDDLRLQVQEMLLGPVNFYADQSQSVVGRKWHHARL